MLDDETLRDGLQSPSVRAPTIDEKIEILHHMDALGIDTADIGLPGAGPHVARDVERLARAIGDGRLKIRANCAARTLIADIKPIADIQQRTGVPIECGAFIGSSPIRQFAEGWTIEFLQKCTEDALTFAAKQGLTTMYVTEDTTRADPASLRPLFTTAIRAGASRLCVADTVGHATPNGARAVVHFVKSVIRDLGVDVGIDWHGHRDRGFGVASSIAALEAGATRLHGAALGIG
jgi:2-isopropylmalate synthase